MASQNVQNLLSAFEYFLQISYLCFWICCTFFVVVVIVSFFDMILHIHEYDVSLGPQHFGYYSFFISRVPLLLLAQCQLKIFLVCAVHKGSIMLNTCSENEEIVSDRAKFLCFVPATKGKPAKFRSGQKSSPQS